MFQSNQVHDFWGHITNEMC